MSKQSKRALYRRLAAEALVFEAEVRSLIVGCPAALTALHDYGERQTTRYDQPGLPLAADLLPTASRRAAQRALSEMTRRHWEMAQLVMVSVHGAAKRYLGMSDLDYDDLVQLGLLGAYEAARRWSPTGGGNPTTFSVWWIRASITRALPSEGRAVRVPCNMMEKIVRLQAIKREMPGATEAELREVLGVSERRFRDLADQMKRLVSLDEKPFNRDGDDDLSLGDRLADEFSEDLLADSLDLKDFADGLSQLFEDAGLLRREKFILTERYGMGSGEIPTLKVLGDRLGLSRERVRQVERLALNKLRAHLGVKLVEGAVVAREPRRRVARLPAVRPSRPASSAQATPAATCPASRTAPSRTPPAKPVAVVAPPAVRVVSPPSRRAAAEAAQEAAQNAAGEDLPLCAQHGRAVHRYDGCRNCINAATNAVRRWERKGCLPLRGGTAEGAVLSLDLDAATAADWSFATPLRALRAAVVAEQTRTARPPAQVDTVSISTPLDALAVSAAK